MSSENATILAFDVGNSCIKAAWIRLGQALEVEPHAHGIAGNLEGWLDGLIHRRPIIHAVVATVNSPVSDRLVTLLKKMGVEVALELKSDGKLFSLGVLSHRLQTPETTGADRILAIIGALEKAAGKAVLVVSCGSAITISAATADRVFVGGAIFPGLALMSEALHRGTAALPMVERGKAPPPIGTSTHGAIASGVHFAIAGGIDRLVAETLSDPRLAEAQVYLTGGDAGRVSPTLKTPHLVERELVFLGMERIVRRWEEQGGARL